MRRSMLGRMTVCLIALTGVAEVHSRFVGATAMELLVDAASG